MPTSSTTCSTRRHRTTQHPRPTRRPRGPAAEARATARDRGAAHPVDPHGDPLTLAVAGLLGEPPGSVRTYDLDAIEVDPGEGPEVAAPVSGRVRLARTNRGLVLEASLETLLAGECARCLRRVTTPVPLTMREEVRPSIDLATGLSVAVEQGADPDAPRLTGHHELELRPLVHEALSLVEPIVFLCDPACPGLCAECGARLEAGHEHAEAAIDPRLEALRAFRVDDRDESE